VPSDTRQEPLLTLRQAAELIPGRGGRPTSPSTLLRWGREGMAGAGGSGGGPGAGGWRRLRIYRIGRRWMTTAADLWAFVAGDGDQASRQSAVASGQEAVEDRSETQAAQVPAREGGTSKRRTAADVRSMLNRELARPGPPGGDKQSTTRRKSGRKGGA
jgi:hypothetical protein